MSNQNKAIFWSVLLGLSLGAIGVFLMGYVSAIAIPENMIRALGNQTTASMVISFIVHFISYGVLAIIVGFSIGNLSSRWMLNSVVCYIALLLYWSVGVSIVYGGEIVNPFFGFSLIDLPVYLTVPLCLLLCSRFTAKRKFSNA